MTYVLTDTNIGIEWADVALFEFMLACPFTEDDA